MNINHLEDLIGWGDADYMQILAKAILLNKVTIVDGRIKVEAFKDNEY